MALSSTSEEIFRFSVVRNPQSVPSDRLADTVVKIVPDDAGAQYKYVTALTSIRGGNPGRRALLAQAARMIAAPEFSASLKHLKSPLWRFVERLQDMPGLSLAQAADLAMSVFGTDAGTLLRDQGFSSDRVLVADSLVLASVVPPPVPGLRTRLMQARRAIAFIERIGEEREAREGTERLLSATLLLPASIFPIPDNNTYRNEENKEKYESRKVALDAETSRTRQVTDQLARNAAAIEELSGSLSSHLHETMSTPSESGPASSISVLPATRVRSLSAGTKKVVLDDLRMTESAVDVPFAVSQLEKANIRLGKDVVANLDDLVLSPGTYWQATCGECKAISLPEPRTENQFSPDTRGVVEVVGIQDLLIVRQKLMEYRAGEISHIENILEGETKGKTHRKLDRLELTTVQETEKEQELENELQTTDHYELQAEASRTIQEDRRIEAGVTVTASYGSVNIEAHGNYASSSSAQESRSSASSFARDVVSRSLQRIRERILSRVTRTQVTETEITNVHSFDNTATPRRNVSGIYRWVDKFYEAQIVNYGKRLMLEFMVPEPGAFYKYARTRKPPSVTDVPKPERPGFCRNGVFTPLSPADLQPENYLCFVAKYNVKNVTAPTPRYLRVSDILKYKIDSTQGVPVSFAESNDSFKIPEGYSPKGVSYVIAGGNSHSATTSNDNHDDIMLVMITIADRKVFRLYRSEIGEADGDSEGQDGWPDLTQLIEWGNTLSQTELDFRSYSIGKLRDEFALPSSTHGSGDPDLVKVSITGHTSLPTSVSVHYTVLCERSQTKFQQWQIDTFNAIVDAYNNLKSDYDDAQRADENAAAPGLEGGNPALNREVEKRELKKHSISILTGQQYESFNAMEQHYLTGIPQIDLQDAAAEGKFVRFFEQALEWRNVTYLFYPYFWGRKANWAETVMSKDADPLFEQFLQAGYARVWVPVRPGFEAVLVNYIECGGEPWSEKDAPIAGQPDEASAPSVALIDEIKEQLGVDFKIRVGTISVELGSTLVTGVDTDFTTDDQDREILIALRYYRIAEVDVVAQTLQLREPFQGAAQDGVGVAIGVKYVGEPWVVSVPTTLVHLRNSDELIIE